MLKVTVCIVRMFLPNTNMVSSLTVAPLCNPTLQVIGLHRPCMEKAGVAVNAVNYI